MTPPLTPPDCDLRAFDWFPLEHKRLRRSSFWLTSSPEVRSISIDLWIESFEQVPAGSLPASDLLLADAAGFGRLGIDRWLAVKEAVLQPWVLCDDGRFYHPVVAEVALKCFIKRLEDRARKKSAAGAAAAVRLQEVKRWLHRLTAAEPETRSMEISMNSMLTGQDRTGQDRTGESTAVAVRTRRSALPDDCPNEGDRQKALAYWAKHGREDISLEREIDIFRARHLEQRTLSFDWSASWRTWYVRAVSFNKRGGGGAQSGGLFADFGRRG